MKIRVLIADDHGVVADGLRNLVKAQADVASLVRFPDADELIALLQPNGRQTAAGALQQCNSPVRFPSGAEF